MSILSQGPVSTQCLIDLVKLCKSILTTAESVDNLSLILNICVLMESSRNTDNELDLKQVHNLAMGCNIHALMRLFIQVIITNPDNHLSDTEVKEYVNEYLDNLRDQLDVSLRTSRQINHISKFIELVNMIKNVLKSQSIILKELIEYEAYLDKCYQFNLKRGGGGLPTYWRKRYLNEIREIVNRV